MLLKLKNEGFQLPFFLIGRPKNYFLPFFVFLQNYSMRDRESKKSSYWVMQPMLFAILLAAGFLLGVLFQNKGDLQISTNKPVASHSSYHKLGEILNFIQTKYVDTIDVERLADVAAEAILKELDPNSYYIPAKEAAKVNSRMQGNLEGIGIEFFVFRDTVFIIDIIPEGPAEKSDLQSGDVILSVNESQVTGKNLSVEEIIGYFQGEVGSVAQIEVLRPMDDERFTVEIARGTIPINSVGASYLIDDDLLYIKLNSFTSKTYREFMQTIEKHISEGQQLDLILDLRHNPGGYLQEAIKILSQFFPRSGLELVETKGLSSKKKTYKTTGNNFFEIGKLAVLIDRSSASASEIIAGVTQDMDRGIVIGSGSYGKGSVQEHYTLSDESALRLTVSKYFIPSGRSIFKNEASDLDGEFLSGNGQQDSFPQQNFMTRNGRIVTQGNAIQPDIEVNADTFFTHAEFDSVFRIVNRMAFLYHRDNPIEFSDWHSFNNRFELTPNWKAQFFEMASEEGFEESIRGLLSRKSNRIEGILKARLARYYFGQDAYYQTLNSLDPVVNTAIDALQNDYNSLLAKSQR